MSTTGPSLRPGHLHRARRRAAKHVERLPRALRSRPTASITRATRTAPGPAGLAPHRRAGPQRRGAALVLPVDDPPREPTATSASTPARTSGGGRFCVPIANRRQRLAVQRAPSSASPDRQLPSRVKAPALERVRPAGRRMASPPAFPAGGCASRTEPAARRRTPPSGGRASPRPPVSSPSRRSSRARRRPGSTRRARRARRGSRSSAWGSPPSRRRTTRSGCCPCGSSSVAFHTSSMGYSRPFRLRRRRAARSWAGTGCTPCETSRAYHPSRRRAACRGCVSSRARAT